MHRLLLISNERAPTRESILTKDKELGNIYLKHYDFDFGGYIVVESEMKLAAFWLIPDDKLKEVKWMDGCSILDSYKLKIIRGN